jgi:16S rRNA processing protein RimM
VPFVKAIVPSVDIEAGTLTVTPPAGLFEELPDDPDDEPAASEAPDEQAPDEQAPDEQAPDEIAPDEVETPTAEPTDR